MLTEATKVNVFLTLEKRSEKKLPCGELEQGKEMETRGRRELSQGFYQEAALDSKRPRMAHITGPFAAVGPQLSF